MVQALIIFLVAFGAVLLLERAVHRMLQTAALLMAGHTEPATLIYALPLLPGVALHEGSHAVMALLLGIKVKHFSLWPQRGNGAIRLGYVEILSTDAVRSSIIGAAPLIFGTLALIAIGLYVFDATALMQALSAGQIETFARQLLATFSAADALLWFFLIFSIANSMMPSPSDTQSWPPVIGFLVVVCGVTFAFGGADLVTFLTPGAQFAARWLAVAFALTAFVDIVVIAFLWTLTRLLERVSGRRVEFRR